MYNTKDESRFKPKLSCERQFFFVSEIEATILEKSNSQTELPTETNPVGCDHIIIAFNWMFSRSAACMCWPCHDPSFL